MDSGDTTRKLFFFKVFPCFKVKMNSCQPADCELPRRIKRGSYQVAIADGPLVPSAALKKKDIFSVAHGPTSRRASNARASIANTTVPFSPKDSDKSNRKNDNAKQTKSLTREETKRLKKQEENQRKLISGTKGVTPLLYIDTQAFKRSKKGHFSILIKHYISLTLHTTSTTHHYH